METMTTRSCHAIACALTLLVAASGAIAQARPDYPKRPVRFIVAQTPGGSADFVGRIVAEALGKRFGQQFVVDNRPEHSSGIARASQQYHLTRHQ